MEATYDLYKKLDLDRSWDTPAIKERLKEIQKMWTLRQAACNDREQLQLIEAILDAVEDGYRWLLQPKKRKEYDAALDEAYQNGTLFDEAEAKLVSLIDQAMEYYKKGNIRLAAECAQKAVDGRVNDVRAYDILVNSLYEMQEYDKALEAVDRGTSIFTTNTELYRLGARIASIVSIGGSFEDAQRRVNALIALNPDASVGHTEQTFLQLCRGDDELAFQEIDAYAAAHPEDEEFRRSSAYMLINYYAAACCFHDESNSEYDGFILEKEDYERAKALTGKAVNLYSDEYTRDQLQKVKHFGKKEFNNWNVQSIYGLLCGGVGLLIIGMIAGIFSIGFRFLIAVMGICWAAAAAFWVFAGVLTYCSFRPYWQIYKTNMTGKMGKTEEVLHNVGVVSGRYGGEFLQLAWKLVAALVKGFVALISALIRGFR